MLLPQDYRCIYWKAVTVKPFHKAQPLNNNVLAELVVTS